MDNSARDHDPAADAGTPESAPTYLTEGEYEGQPWLHLYGQFSNHCEARLIGNPAALISLAAALTEAAENGRSAMRALASDGEGYEVRIERTNSTGLGYSRLPYTAEWQAESQAEQHDRLRERIAELEGAPSSAEQTADADPGMPT